MLFYDIWYIISYMMCMTSMIYDRWDEMMRWFREAKVDPSLTSRKKLLQLTLVIVLTLVQRGRSSLLESAHTGEKHALGISLRCSPFPQGHLSPARLPPCKRAPTHQPRLPPPGLHYSTGEQSLHCLGHPANSGAVMLVASQCGKAK